VGSLSNLEKLVRKIENVSINLMNPIFDAFESSTLSKNNKNILLAGANFCAVSSIITTFLGLVEYYKKEILSFNIIISILCIIVCICLTAGLQYVLLAFGIKTGIRCGKICKSKAFRDFTYIIITVIMFFLYLVPMSVSSIFSFSSLFSGVSKLVGFNNMVNTEVWLKTEIIAKQQTDNVIYTYNQCNENISYAIETQHQNYMNLSQKLIEWDANNANSSIDNIVNRFEKRISGIDKYKQEIENLLISDENNEFILEMQEQQIFYENQYHYSIYAYKIIEPYEIPLNELEDGDYNNTGESKRNGDKYYKKVDKYQLIDILFKEYIYKLNVTNETITEASMNNNDDDIVNLNTNGNLIDTNWLMDMYYDNIFTASRIYNSFIEIKDKMKSDNMIETEFEEPRTPAPPDNMPLPSPTITPIPTPTPTPTPIPTPMSTISNTTELVESMDRKNKIYYDSVSKLNEMIINYAENNNEDNKFETKMSKIIEILNCLPELDKDIIAINALPKPTLIPIHTSTPPIINTPIPKSTEKEMDNWYERSSDLNNPKVSNEVNTKVSNEVNKITNYYNYAIGRNANLSFGLDIVYHGNKFKYPLYFIMRYLFLITDNTDLNTNNDNITTIYAQSEFVTTLFIIAHIVDFIPIIVGFIIGTNSGRKLSHKYKKLYKK